MFLSLVTIVTLKRIIAIVKILFAETSKIYVEFLVIEVFILLFIFIIVFIDDRDDAVKLLEFLSIVFVVVNAHATYLSTFCADSLALTQGLYQFSFTCKSECRSAEVRPEQLPFRVLSASGSVDALQ